MRDGYSFRRLSNFTEHPDGETFGFRIERQDGEEFDLSVDRSDIVAIVSSLIELASEHAFDAPVPPSTQNELSPIPALGIGFQIDDDRETTILMMRTVGMDLAFRIPNSGLVHLADDLVRIVRTLSAPTTKN